MRVKEDNLERSCSIKTVVKFRPFMRYAYNLAKTSHDPSTQNAAILIDDGGNFVTSGDVNRFPLGVNEKPKERWERPLKYRFIEHAERNVIYRAAALGHMTRGLTMVCPWAPCADCARAIIQAGIKLLVTHRQAHDRTPQGTWGEDIQIALVILEEAGVGVVWFDAKVGGVEGVLHSGELWNP